MIKKRVLSLGVLILSMGLLCSCGGDKETNKEETKKPTTEVSKPVTQRIQLNVDKQYKNDKKIKLSSKNDSINVYMPTRLSKSDSAVVVYPLSKDQTAAKEKIGKDYSVIGDNNIEAIVAKQANNESVYYFFCEGVETTDFLNTINPDGKIVQLQHKGVNVKTTGVSQDKIFRCCSVFDLSGNTSLVMILEGDHEFTEKEITSYIDRLEYK